MKNLFSILSIAVAIVACSSSYAQPETQTNPFGIENGIDHFLKTVNLKNLVGQRNVVNLIAQMSDADASTTDANHFDNFLAIAVDNNDGHTTITEFDHNQTILKTQSYDSPWLGVNSYKQKNIPAMSLQQGWRLAQACMASKGDPVSEKISGVVIYKTIFGQTMIYDYVVQNGHLPMGLCPEVLYIPATNDCLRGMVTRCHFDPVSFYSLHNSQK